jgi:hypothetical protein
MIIMEKENEVYIEVLILIFCIIFVLFGYCILFIAQCKFLFLQFCIGLSSFVIVSSTGNV